MKKSVHNNPIIIAGLGLTIAGGIFFGIRALKKMKSQHHVQMPW